MDDLRLGAIMDGFSFLLVLPPRGKSTFPTNKRKVLQLAQMGGSSKIKSEPPTRSCLIQAGAILTLNLVPLAGQLDAPRERAVRGASCNGARRDEGAHGPRCIVQWSSCETWGGRSPRQPIKKLSKNLVNSCVQTFLSRP